MTTPDAGAALTAEERAEIVARWAKATPGPWRAMGHLVLGPEGGDMDVCDCALGAGSAEPGAAEDAEAIAHAPTDIARLLAALTAAEAERDNLLRFARPIDIEAARRDLQTATPRRDKAAEHSRIDAENLRQRVPPVQP